jgi:hypothetical protein
MPRAPLLSQQPTPLAPLPTVTRGDQSPNAFGAGLGQAVQQVGQDVGAAVDARERQKALEDRIFVQQSEQRATDASNMYQAELGQAKMESMQLQGNDALEAGPMLQQKIATLRSKYEADLSGNPIAIDNFNKRAAVLDLDAHTSVTAYSVAQKRGADIGAQTAAAKGWSDVAVRNADSNPAVYEAAIGAGLEAVRKQSELVGDSPQETQRKETEYFAQQHNNIIDFRLKAGDLAGATSWFEKNKDTLLPEQRAAIEGRLTTAHKADMSTQVAAATFAQAGLNEVQGLAYLDKQLEDGKIDGETHKLALTAYKGRVTIAEGAQKQAIEGITQNASNAIYAFSKDPNGAPDANTLPQWIQANPAAWDVLPVERKNQLLAQQDAALKGNQPDPEFLSSVETAIRQDPEGWAKNVNLAAMRHQYGNKYDDYAQKRNDILSGKYADSAEAKVSNVANQATNAAWLVINGSDGVKTSYKPEQKAALEEWVRNAIRSDQKQNAGKIGNIDEYASQAREYLQAQNAGTEMTAFTPIPTAIPEGGLPLVNTLSGAKSTTAEYGQAARQLHAWAPRYYALRVKTPEQKVAYEGGLKALVRGNDEKLQALRKGIKAAHPNSDPAEIDQWVINATLKANQSVDAPPASSWFPTTSYMGGD